MSHCLFISFDTGTRREDTSSDPPFAADELYYNTVESDYEDDVHMPDQHEEEQNGGDEHEVPFRSPSRSPSPLPGLSALRITPFPVISPSPLRITPPFRSPSPF